MHKPVLIKEVIELLNPQPGEIVIDGTVGLGGHFKAFWDAVQPNGRLIGTDVDCQVIAYTQHWLKSYLAEGKEIQSVELFCDNFVNIDEIMKSLNLKGVDIILLDLGVSSYQLDTPERGFSFRADGPLDMRMNPKQELTAERIINRYKLDKLIRIFREYGEERWAVRIARNIVNDREKGDIKTTRQLAEIAEKSVPYKRRIHPATRIFQALRIEVNQELDNLRIFLVKASGYLNTGGRMGIISFHSLEDRLVKEAFNRGKREGIYEILAKKPIQASELEIAQNSRARSAKLRGVKKV